MYALTQFVCSTVLHAVNCVCTFECKVVIIRDHVIVYLLTDALLM